MHALEIVFLSASPLKRIYTHHSLGHRKGVQCVFYYMNSISPRDSAGMADWHMAAPPRRDTPCWELAPHHWELSSPPPSPPPLSKGDVDGGGGGGRMVLSFHNSSHHGVVADVRLRIWEPRLGVQSTADALTLGLGKPSWPDRLCPA